MKYPHWQYFLALENDLIATARYVELSEDNFSTFSIEFARILQSTSSEVDVLCKMLCNRISPLSQPKNMDEYRKLMLKSFPKFPTIKIQVPRLEQEIFPWSKWELGSNPDWWQHHNDVKHERHKHFAKANLRNSLYALCGLFALVLYLYQPEVYRDELAPFPQLLDYENFPAVRIVSSGILLPDFPKS